MPRCRGLRQQYISLRKQENRGDLEGLLSTQYFSHSLHICCVPMSVPCLFPSIQRNIRHPAVIWPCKSCSHQVCLVCCFLSSLSLCRNSNGGWEQTYCLHGVICQLWYVKFLMDSRLNSLENKHPLPLCWLWIINNFSIFILLSRNCLAVVSLESRLFSICDLVPTVLLT